MRSLKEGSSHELYLRASSAAKPMAPLKLYANVTGKFTVERELGEKVQDKIRESTQVAEKQRTERKAILLDAPPDIPRVNGKKRKAPPGSSTSLASTPLLKRATHGDHVRNISASDAVPSRVASPLPPQASPLTTTKESLTTLRKRLIHCLAGSQRLADDVVRLVGGSDRDPSGKKEIVDLLEEVGCLSHLVSHLV